MTRYAIYKTVMEFKTAEEIKKGCTYGADDRAPELVAEFATESDALQALQGYQTEVWRYNWHLYAVTEYTMEPEEWDADGEEWISTGDAECGPFPWVLLDGDFFRFDDLVPLMDDEIREQVHAELAPCSNQEFINRYNELHEAKYDEYFSDAVHQF